MARRPPGFRTRNASAKTAALSGDRLMTQLERTTSTVASATGSRSISPRRKSTFVAFSVSAFARALRDHRRGHVDADDAPGWADLLRREEAVEPAAAAEVEDGLAGPQGGDGPEGSRTRAPCRRPPERPPGPRPCSRARGSHRSTPFRSSQAHSPRSPAGRRPRSGPAPSTASRRSLGSSVDLRR